MIGDEFVKRNINVSHIQQAGSLQGIYLPLGQVLTERPAEVAVRRAGRSGDADLREYR
jgi:hypothetical protein